MAFNIQRLKKSLDFKKITNGGLKVYSLSFLLFYIPNYEDLRALKIGFTASKKIGGAVQRNRCKRIMKSLVTDVLSKNITISFHCVMVAKPSMLIIPYSKLEKEVMFCIKRMEKSIISFDTYAQKIA
ncbi:MAG: ribonuclease P protein component [Candidatus Midichloria sp.]|nr:MAG: ribonuclease P protein component [Candidatus Midichloria sp.]